MTTPTPPPPLDPVHGGLPSLTPDVSFLRESMRLLARLKTLRDMQDADPPEASPDLSDMEYARRLSWDMVTALTRSSVVLDIAISILADHTEALHQQNQAAARKAQEEREQREERRWFRGLVRRGSEGVFSAIGRVLSDTRVVYAVSGGVATILGTLFAVLVAYIAIRFDVPVPTITFDAKK